MKDRVPTHPGRVELTDVETGITKKYDMTMADDPTQYGTPLNKATLLKDQTADLFGYTSDVVPDDILSSIGQYKKHWWSVLHSQSGYRYVENQTEISTRIEMSGSGITSISYAPSISVNESTGAVSLVGATTISIGTYPTRAQVNTLKAALQAAVPCYIKNSASNSVYFLPSDSTFGYRGTFVIDADADEDYYFELGYGSQITGPISRAITPTIEQIQAGETTYVHSTNRHAYPDSGTVEGLTYTYLGVPFDTSVKAPKIETGSYVGTGTYGSANPNTISLGFTPQIVFIFQPSFGALARHIGESVLYPTSGKGRCDWEASTDNEITVTVSGTSISWYSAKSSTNQSNKSGITYYYVAFGVGGE